MFKRKTTTLFLMLNFLLFISLVGLMLQSSEPDRSRRIKIATTLLITDLCLTTESRHTRHLSTAELMAPFQDFPGGPDHFPSSMFLQHSNIYFSRSIPEKVK